MNIPCLARNISHNTSLFKNLITRKVFFNGSYLITTSI